MRSLNCRRLGLVLLSTAVVAGTVTSLAAPAGAATSWHFGALTTTTINDCFDGYIVTGVGEYAGVPYDSAAPPLTGDVTYVETVITGVDASCTELALPDISLPAGARTAISSKNPIKCYTYNNSTKVEKPDTADCPSSLGAPLSGGTGSIRNRNGRAPGFWDLANNAIYVITVPITTTTAGYKTIGFPTTIISGDIVQPDQTLDPTVTLPSVAANPMSQLAVPKAISHQNAITRGVHLTLQTNRTSTVTITWQVKAKGAYRTLAHEVARNLAAGKITATMTVAKKARHYLAKPVKTRLSVVVQPTRGPSASMTKTVAVTH